MAEVFTASTDPVTGQRREFRQEVAPPPPPDYGMGSINPAAVAELYRTQKIADAEKAVSAAIQFQGLRGYQQALKSGEPAEKALARYGPMMFYSKPQALGPSVRAVTPPQINPNQAAALEFRKQQAALPPKPIYRAGPGGSTVRINPQDDSVKTLVPGAQPKRVLNPAERADQEIAKAAYKAAVEELEATPKKEPRKFFGATFGGNLEEVADLEKKRDEARAKLSGQAAATPTGPETVRLTKDGKKAIFDSQTKKFLRYAD